MKKTHVWCAGWLSLLLAAGVCLSNDTGSKTSISCAAGLEVGQIVHGSYLYSFSELQEITRGWQERFLYRLAYNMSPTERIRVITEIEGQISFSYPQILSNSIDDQSARFLFVPERMEGIYTLGDQTQPHLQFGLGYFPYKFNPDAKDLGELMFRSGTYPLWVIANFNHCYGKLLGFRISSTLLGSLRQDLMLTSEALMFPTQDYSLSYLAHYSLMRMVDVGAGITLAHLFSTESKYTTNKTDPESMYLTANGDTAYYGFTGTKVSATCALDPKQALEVLLGDDVKAWLDKWLGTAGGRLYGEVFVSGWENRKNYDSLILHDSAMQSRQYFAARHDRTVTMVGFNWPTHPLLSYTVRPGVGLYCNTHKFGAPTLIAAGAGIVSGTGLWLLEKYTGIKTGLDVLSLEFEYFPNRYPNSYRNILERNLATPFNPTIKKQLPWKWSLYGKKSIGQNLFIVGEVARDHMRTTFPDIKLSEKEDVLKYAQDWWWTVSLNFKL